MLVLPVSLLLDSSEGDLMNLADIASTLLDTGLSVFQNFNVTFGDVSINGWALLIGGAVAMIFINLLGRIFE